MSSRFGHFSLAIFALTFVLSPLGHAQQPAAAPSAAAAAAAPGAPAAPVDPATQLIQDAIQKMNANDVDGSLAKLTQAIQANPKSGAAYVLRASIYCQKKQWPQAEADFNSALKLAPTNVVIKFNLVEIKFMQKQFDAARAGYVALKNDPDMGELASFKIFLCDLGANHEDAATKELAAFNDNGSGPSYYFSNAAWCIYKKKIEDARGWLVSGSRIFAPRKTNYYLQPLADMGYLPLPTPPKPQ